jgi:hypothetical protein
VEIIARASSGEPLNGAKSASAARCKANFSKTTAKCGTYVGRGGAYNITNPAHFQGDVVTLRFKCNAENKAAARCAIVSLHGCEVQFTCRACGTKSKITVSTYSPKFQEAVARTGLELVRLHLCPASATTKHECDLNERVLFSDAVCLKCKQKCSTESQYSLRKTNVIRGTTERKECNAMADSTRSTSRRVAHYISTLHVAGELFSDLDHVGRR